MGRELVWAIVSHLNSDLFEGTSQCITDLGPVRSGTMEVPHIFFAINKSYRLLIK